MKPKVNIIGAGFSGLVTARAFVRRGFSVCVYEKEARAGGMIQSVHHPLGLYEKAANGILNSPEVLELFVDCGVEIKTPPPVGRRRYIYRGRRLRQWPLSFMETVTLLSAFVKSWWLGQLRPKTQESIKQWCERVLTKPAYQFLLAPALQGIYAGDATRLSASLLLRRLFSSRRKKVRPRGTVFPTNGMEQLLQGLQQFLIRKGVNFQLRQTMDLPQNRSDLWVVATNAAQAVDLLQHSSPEVALNLKKIEMLPLVTVQVYTAQEKIVPGGFGALFPRDSGVRSLGVLWDHDLFPWRGNVGSERWILGGSTDAQVVGQSDQEITEIIRQDRHTLGLQQPWQDLVITRWPQALPHYTIELEEILQNLVLPDQLALIGNYMGAIGLGQILQQAEDLAQKWESQFGK